MSAKVKPLDPLQPRQRDASNPAELVWLSASAGTGSSVWSPSSNLSKQNAPTRR